MSFWSRVVGLSVSLVLGSAALARAGDLAVSQHGSTLKVKGDHLDASAVFTSQEPNAVQVNGLVRVIPNPGTTVNGVAAIAEFSGVTQISVAVGAASSLIFDHVELDAGITVKNGPMLAQIFVTSSQLGGNLSVSSGQGTLGFDCDDSLIAGKLNVKSGGAADSASLRCVVEGSAQVSLGDGANDLDIGGGSYASLSIKSGGGVDVVTAEAPSIATSLKLALGAGVNHLTLQSTLVGENLAYAGGGGGDFLTAQSLQVGESASFKLGGGGNSLALEDSLFGANLTVVGGSGNDTVTFSGTMGVGGKTKFSLGGGVNTSP